LLPQQIAAGRYPRGERNSFRYRVRICRPRREDIRAGRVTVEAAAFLSISIRAADRRLHTD